VDVGEAFGGRVAVKNGLAEGDRVVTSGNFMIDSESRMRTPAPQSAKAPADSHADAPAVASTKGHPPAHDMNAMGSVEEVSSGESVDPACGMPLSADVAKAAKYSATYHGRKFVFCSENCKKKFDGDPDKHAGEKTQTASSGQAGIGAP